MEMLTEIQSAKDVSDALSCIVRAFGADTGTLHLLEDDGLLHLKALSGQFPPPVLAVIREIPVGKGMAGLAVERGQPEMCIRDRDTSKVDTRKARALASCFPHCVTLLVGRCLCRKFLFDLFKLLSEPQ